MPDLEIRPARPADFPAVADLRRRWAAGRDPRPDDRRGLFADAFVTWARDHAKTHRCLVAVDDETVVGMGFLAITPRVPTPASATRFSGDLQCVYVTPEHRGTGLGGRLVDALLALAADLGLERVTVHSSARAVPVYERHGFAASPHLLQVKPVR